MRVTVATGIYPPEIGGPATYLARLVPKMKERGWKVQVVTYGSKRPGAVTVPRNWHRFFSFFRQVYKSARNSDIIFSTDTFSSGFPSAVAAWLLNKPFVVRFVGDAVWENARSSGWVDESFDDFQEKRYGLKISLLRFIQKKVLKSAEVFTVSRFLRSVLKKWGILNSHLVPNAVVDFELLPKKVLRKKLDLGNYFVVLVVGRLTKYKRVDEIIRAGKQAGIPNLLLVIVGDGPEKEKLKQLAGRNVRFVGRKNARQTREFMKAADVLVLNSEYEGMSHTLLEAMSVKCPVAASSVGGNKELVEGAGLLFDDIDSLKKCLLKYYNSPDLRKKYSEKALRKINEQDKVDNLALDLLERVAEGKK